MTTHVNLDNLAIVLHRPRYPENIGAAARAMHNMGFRELIVVAPQNCDLTRILKMATHAAIDIVEQMSVFETLQEALLAFNYVIGTTARLGKQRQVIASPAKLAEKLIPMSQTNRIALLFGSEDRGLLNEDIRLCHDLVTIPTADFPSLNLAQAVMIICYEMFLAGRQNEIESVPRLATRHELDGMYEQLKDILVRIDYINHENPDYWMNRVRQFFTRMRLRAREVSIIRGICRQIDWYAEKRYKNGLNRREKI
ncbi:MAG: RNA methyltransferase [Deltaproteobacteria bacterium]|jgi:tRNA/rRNA methyltransferase|nr:RNA methyltransferase [Deltaproteobacteria bacterium]